MATASGRRWFWKAYVGLVLVLAAISAADPDGLRKHLRLQENVLAMRRENARLEEDIARLEREARGLRSDPAAIERAAREELRWVRPGERVYRLDAGTGSAP
jgi:cell division protein FtsB